MNKNPRYDHLEQYKWQKGQSGNALGRPRSYVTILKELGYTKPLIATMTAEVMFMTHQEVETLANSKTEPIIRRIIANAFRSADYDGEFKYIEPYMKILFGRTIPYISKDGNNTSE